MKRYYVVSVMALFLYQLAIAPELTAADGGRITDNNEGRSQTAASPEDHLARYSTARQNVDRANEMLTREAVAGPAERAHAPVEEPGGPYGRHWQDHLYQTNQPE